MLVKVLCSDLDGTLFVHGTISKAVYESIQSFQKKGNLFGIASGRSLQQLLKKMKKYSIQPDFYIACNGALLFRNNEVHVVKTIPFDLVENVRKIALKHHVQVFAIGDGIHHEVLKTHLSWLHILVGKGASIYLDSQPISHENIAAIYIKDARLHVCRAIEKEINQLYGNELEVKINCGINVDITYHGVTKAEAIREMFANEDVEIYTIGDSFNDISMIEAFYGYAMENGNNQVKQVAKKVVSSVKEAIEDLED